jgi:glycosyltransferase involved in cell wall biosynthesis
MTSSKKIPASVLIIGQNTEKFLKRCLDSLIDFEEIIFIDGGSIDRTEEIAKSYPNVKFFMNPWPGFIKQRNLSLEKATKAWSFMIDADEAATPELVKKIGEIVELNDRSVVMYRIVRTEYFESKAIEIGHGRSEYQERLFQTNRVKYTGGVHHTHLIDDKPISEQQNFVRDFNFSLRILHDPDYRIEEMLTKLPRFSMYVGTEKFNNGRRVSAFEVLFSFVWTALRMMFRSRKMGKRGIVLAFMKAYSDSLSKLYIYNLQNFRNIEKSSTDQKYLG